MIGPHHTTFEYVGTGAPGDLGMGMGTARYILHFLHFPLLFYYYLLSTTEIFQTKFLHLTVISVLAVDMRVL